MAFHSYAHLIQKLFNAYWCGPPSRVTGTSPWTCVDHPVSRLPHPTHAPCSGSLSLRLRDSCHLTSPDTATRRFIMQKARRHHTKWLRPLVGAWFQVLFHSPNRGAFHRSLTVLSTIGLTGVFSLAGWSRRIRAGFLVPRVTQDTTRPSLDSYTELSSSTVELSRSFFPGRSPLLGESLLFSLPAGTKMFQFPALASPQKSGDSRPSDGWVVPFGNLRIKGHLHLPGAFRSLSRPSSPP